MPTDRQPPNAPDVFRPRDVPLPEARLDSLAIVMPAYNEVRNVDAAVRKALSVARRCATTSWVIVVDDGSRDGTREACLEVSDPSVICLRHDANRGYGAALATGFTEAARRAEWVFYTDADNQFDLTEIEDCLPLLRDVDALVGFRVYRQDSVLRCMLSWAYNRLVNLLFGLSLRDVDCSFKFFRSRLLAGLRIESPDFFVDTELMAKCRRRGWRILQRGVRHYPRTAGATTVRPSDIPRTLRTLSRMWIRIYLQKRI